MSVILRTIYPENDATIAGSRLNELVSGGYYLDIEPSYTTSSADIPDQIDRYQIRSVLGRGKIVNVCYAYDLDLEREVVLKLITVLSSLDISGELLQRFRHEIQAAGRLRHPHIVTMYHADLRHKPPYVVMEWLTGGTLTERLKGKALPWQEALTLLRPLIEALSYAHLAGVIHRDVKPANVMFAQDGTLKLVDFGMAYWHTTEKLAETGAMAGTPIYMAPEQIWGEAVDHRVDIFALGIILYEAIVGCNPLAQGSPIPNWVKFASNEQIDLPSLPAQVPSRVIGLIKRAMARDRDQRYETCQELLADLDSCLDSSLGGGRPEIEPPYGTMRPDSRFYIERAADDHCWEYISKPYATTLFIQAPRQMGKSSLMHRMIDRAEKSGRRAVFIDFQEFSKQYFTDADEKGLLIELCSMIGNALELPEATNQHWQGPQADLVKCGLYLSKYILPQINEPFILAMDEVDRMLTSPFRANFFGMLRTWHNKRVYDENFAKMTLLLSSSTEPFLLIDDPNQSPFNVAEIVSLEDFTRQEVEELNRRHNSPLNSSQVSNLIALVGGHPFLNRVALYQLATGKMNLDTLLDQATEDSGPFGEHLHRYLLRILKQPELKQAMIQICHTHVYKENETFYRLKSMGLIKKAGQQVMLRNNLYAHYFEEHLYD